VQETTRPAKPVQTSKSGRIRFGKRDQKKAACLIIYRNNCKAGQLALRQNLMQGSESFQFCRGGIFS
jgi:hypothetical protein